VIAAAIDDSGICPAAAAMSLGLASRDLLNANLDDCHKPALLITSGHSERFRPRSNNSINNSATISVVLRWPADENAVLVRADTRSGFSASNEDMAASHTDRDAGRATAIDQKMMA
jgi:hypothetical protein